MLKSIFCALTAVMLTISNAHCSEFMNKDTHFDDAADFGDVYGVVSFELRSPYTQHNVQSVLQNLARALVNASGKDQGNALLTIDLEGSDGNVAVKLSKPLLSVSWQNHKLLFFTTAKGMETVTVYNGTLLDNLRTDPQKNKWTVTISAKYTEDMSFDAKIFSNSVNLFANFVSGGPFISAATQTVVSQFSKLLEPPANTHNIENSDQITGEMQFINPGSIDGTAFKTADAKFAFPWPDGQQAYLSIRINFATRPTLFSHFIHDDAGGHFEGSFTPTSFLIQADQIVHLTGEKNLTDVLLAKSDKDSDDDKQAKEFVAKLLGGGKYEGSDVGDRCKHLLKFLGKFFSNRDMYAVYWAFLGSNSDKLSASSANSSRCVTDQKEELQRLHLDPAKILAQRADWPGSSTETVAH